MAQVHQTETGAVDVAFSQGPMALGLSRIKSASVQVNNTIIEIIVSVLKMSLL